MGDHKLIRVAVLLLTITTLVSCKTSDGSDSSDNNDIALERDGDDAELIPSERVSFADAPAGELLVLNAENAEQIVALLLRSVAQTRGFSGAEVEVAALEELLEGNNGFDLDGFVWDEGLDFLQLDAQALGDGASEQACRVGGALSAAIDVPENEGGADEISVRADFDSCDFGNGLLLNGALEFVGFGLLQALEAGLGEDDNYGIAATFQGLEFHQPDLGFRVNGSVAFDAERTDSMASLNIVSGSLLFAGLEHAFSWENFALEANREFATDAYSMTFGGTAGLNIPGVGNGKLVLVTERVLTGGADSPPEQGVFHVQGGRGSEITLVVEAGGLLSIELVQGDGVAPLRIASSWDALSERLAELALGAEG